MKKATVQCRFVLVALITVLIISCSGAQTSEPISEPVSLPSTFAFSNGADVSWLPQMEATGYKFYDTDGTTKDCLKLLKDRGINTIRLRVFVNPSTNKHSGHCSPAETVVMALRAQKMGMRIMIDFHYSDTWADPGHQAKPAAWANSSFAELQNHVYKHTFDVLHDLKVAGVTPEWVQVGNEIPSGILWPDGKIENNQNWNQLAVLLNKGYEATKAVNPAIKVITHVDQGNNNGRFRWFFDNLTTQKLKYDVIGLSYYPYWLGQEKGKEELKDYTKTIADLEFNLKDMVSRYGKEVMVVEVGGDYTLVQNTNEMLKAVSKAVKSVPNNKGLGVIYWEPQGEKSWSGYQLNAWQSDGKPSPALDAFKN
jgi:arabinogalactan endo-1,4-beta-galactosidase